MMLFIHKVFNLNTVYYKQLHINKINRTITLNNDIYLEYINNKISSE